MLNLKQVFKTTAIAVLSLCFITSSIFTASASRNGIERKTNTFAIGLTFKLGGIDQVCSAALISSTFLVTAGHCMFDENGTAGTNYYFTKPGVALDEAIDPSARQPKILKVFTPQGYKVNAADQKDDIAFVQLDIPLANTGFIRIATAAEIEQLSSNQLIKGYGYGHVYETNADYSIYAREYPLNWELPKTTPPTTVQIHSATATACSGDSGGPITTTTTKGEEILIAVMSGAAQVVNNCGTSGGDNRFIMQATVVDTYKTLMPVIAPTPKPTIAKRYKITCVKGKIKKYITGTNPKCPAGYKQTAKVVLK